MDDPVGYLFRTAMNIRRSAMRRAAVATRKAIGRIPSDELEAVDSADAIVRVLASLTPRQRAAVVLTNVLGLTSGEAGAAMRASASTVRVLAGRGRETLRKELGRDG